MFIKRLHSSHFAALLVSLLLAYSHWQTDALQTITWDPFGYYIYLPAAVIQDDLMITDTKPMEAIATQYQLLGPEYYYQKMENGRHVMKYTMGMAVLYSPAFLVAHGIAKASGYPADGFSPPYQYAVLYWSLGIALLGLWVLRHVLAQLYGHGVAAALLVAIGIGTNYYMHVMRAGDSVMTHGYLFTGYALVLYLTMRWHAEPRMGRILPLALTCGLMTLIRPTEGICLLIPLLWDVQSMASLRAKAVLLWQSRLQLLAFTGLLLLIGLPQFLYWKAGSGHFIHTAYGGDAGEGMDWLRPHLVEVLVGFRKGWLTYTPLMAVAIVGLVALYRRQRAAFWAVLVYLVLDVYLVSAWSTYWYAYCFGQRALIPTMAVMSLPLGALLAWAFEKGWPSRIAAGAVLLLCISLNLFQSYQYDSGLLDGDRMTWDYYKAIFGKRGVPDAERRHLLVHRRLPDTQPIEFPKLYAARHLMTLDFDTVTTTAQAPRLNGSPVMALHPGNPYSTAIDTPYAALLGGQDHAFMRVSGMAYTRGAADGFSLVTHGYYRGQHYAYRQVSIPLQAGQWQPFTATRITSELRTPADIQRLYLYYTGPDTLYVEDLRIEVLTRKPVLE
jgi:hypothetical protein